jgi:predicted regulator of Ras-like GTPase activity (Roadblock/LC7/MglB family)
MRQDQEHEEAIEHFDTPFSFHAKEDQKRFGKPRTEAPKDGEPAAEAAKVETPTVMEGQAPASPIQPESADVAGVAGVPPSIESETKPVESKVDQAADQTATDQPGSPPPATMAADSPVAAVEAKNNAKEFVLRVSCLPGITGCSIAFADGLTMAGNLPPRLGADGICAMAPSVLQKVQKHMLDADLGSLNSMTLHCSKSPLSFFMQGNVCLTVLHTDQNLEPVTQEQLVEMTKELAQMFAQPETTHVDH